MRFCQISHEDQGNINIPQHNDLIDDHSSVNDFLDNLQLPSPQGSEISYGNIMSVNTLVGFLDESIEILQRNERSHEDPMSVNKMKVLPQNDSDVSVPSTEHSDFGNSENTYNCHLCHKSFSSGEDTGCSSQMGSQSMQTLWSSVSNVSLI